MKIQIICMGKIKQRFVLEGEAEYLKRMKSWIKLELIELEPKGDGLKELRAFRKPADLLILLDEAGAKKSSEQFAGFFAKEMNNGRSNIIFAIGAAFGWSSEAKKEADFTLSLSPMTFTYQMSRLILVEQIYRAFSIVKGQPYHKA